jgi:hypothetical protein
MRNGFLGALGLLMAMAIAFWGACAPSSSGGNHPADDDASPADDDASPTDDDDNDTTPPADDDGSPADDDNDDSSPADDDDNDDDSATDVFAVGLNGAIVHYDGASWSPMTSGTPNDLTGIWGNGGSDVFVVGYPSVVLHYDGSLWSTVASIPDTEYGGLACVWGTSPSDVFAAGYEGGQNGVILHYDGTAWLVQWTAGVSLGVSEIRGVWGIASTNDFVVGESSANNAAPFPPIVSGLVLDNKNGSWTEMNNTGSLGPLNAVWGTSQSDVFAVGWIPNSTGNPGGNLIMHYDGLLWSNMPVPTDDTAFVAGIWGASSSDAFAVGADYEGGFVFRYDGSSWSTATNAASGLYGIWGSSAADVFAVGRDNDAGVILHYDGSSWTTTTAGLSNSLNAVWGVKR